MCRDTPVRTLRVVCLNVEGVETSECDEEVTQNDVGAGGGEMSENTRHKHSCSITIQKVTNYGSRRRRSVEAEAGSRRGLDQEGS